ncbi:MAG: NIPSNAP family protein [Gemmatimonadetes bacterium]|nr:NIPSNAP family protein [Gemmatimonadota bacterium]MDE2701049.1 NIPSNAP family protein [Gemmatimonadota bacterium]
MIYDMRTYDLNPGALQTYMDAVREVALPLREDYGVKLAGWYYTDIGKLNRVVHIWAYRDYTHFDQARQAVRSDPRWVNDYLPRVKGLVVRQQDQIMLASDFFESRVPALSEDA